MHPLAVVGNVNVDLIMGPFDPWPQPGTEVIAAQDDLRPGGAAGNTALAWMGLGVPFRLASNVGNDPFGHWLRAAFAGHSDDWTVSDCGTTISVGITHPGDERTFFTTRGHLPRLSWQAVLPQVDGMRGGTLLLCGCFLTDALTAEYDSVFDWAEQSGVDIALDPGCPPAGWTAAELARAGRWLSRTRHLLVNEVEALALTGAAAVNDALPALVALLPQDATAVVKTGPRGAVALTGTTHAEAAAPVVAVIDTIGAGDIFNAGYLLAIAEGAGLHDALAAGVGLASAAISTAPRRYQRQNGPE